MKINSNRRNAIAIIVSICVVLGIVLGLVIFFNATIFTKNKFTIMSTTDVHGKVWNEYLESGKKEPDNLLCAATAAKRVRDQYGEKTLLWDNGDLYQGSILSTIDIPQKLTDINSSVNPTALAVNYMNYDGFNFGNHEFNYSYSALDPVYEYLKENGIPHVCANIYYKGNGERVFSPYFTKKINVDGTEIKIGVIGLENTDCPRWDEPGNYNSWIFHSKENPNADISYEIAKAQKEMEKNGDICDFTIVSYHGGFFAEGSTSASDFENFEEKLEKKINDPVELYKNTESQGYRALRQSKGIDMFILGHDHTDIYSNHQYKNAEGKDVLVVNGAKKYMTESVFELVKDSDSSKPKIKLVESKNVQFSTCGEDSNLRNKIRPYVDSTNRLLSKDIVQLSDSWDLTKKSDDCFVQQTDMTDLINRAQQWYATKFLREKYQNKHELNEYIKKWVNPSTDLQFDENEPLEADLSITSGVPNANIEPNSMLNYNDAASLYSYDNQIVIVPVIGSTIKDMIEYNATQRYQVKVDKDGKKSIQTIKDKYTCPLFGGLNFKYDMTKPEGNRAIIEGFANGKSFNPNKTYCMAMNSYVFGNTSNAVLGSIDQNSSLHDVASDGPQELCKNAIVLYGMDIEKKYKAFYPTKECEKNGEHPFHWSFIY